MVLDVQLVVTQVSSPSCAVAVRSYVTAKFTPNSERDMPPETGTLSTVPSVTTGASYETYCGA
jgi:hypothetical protein